MGRELAGLGLSTALASGDPRTVLSWSERSRAQAFRVLPVKAPQDPQTAEALAELRQLRHQLRTPSWPASGTAPARPAAPSWSAPCANANGRPVRGGEQRPERDAGAIRAALGRPGPGEFHGTGTGLVALVVSADRARLVPLSGGDTVPEMIRRLLADVDALAGRSLPDRIEAVIRASVQRQVQSIGEVLLTPLAALIGDRRWWWYRPVGCPRCPGRCCRCCAAGR